MPIKGAHRLFFVENCFPEVNGTIPRVIFGRFDIFAFNTFCVPDGRSFRRFASVRKDFIIAGSFLVWIAGSKKTLDVPVASKRQFVYLYLFH
ncbi:MAG: hypothetical protein KAJ90_00460 [Desulfobacterales bacterium]|nr:hypothetical protein [Desulfobacterales bacterium]